MSDFESSCGRQLLSQLMVISTSQDSCPHESQHGTRTYPFDHNKQNMADLMGYKCQIRFFKFVSWIFFFWLYFVPSESRTCGILFTWQLVWSPQLNSHRDLNLAKEVAMCNYLAGASFLSLPPSGWHILERDQICKYVMGSEAEDSACQHRSLTHINC